MIPSTPCVLFVAALCAAAPDEVKLKSGREFKNLKLEKETASEYRFVDLEGKQVVVPKLNVAEYVPKPTVREEIATKRETLAGKDAGAWIKLAAWAKENGALEKDLKPLYEEALQLDGENAEARAALGWVKKDGKWMNAADEAKESAKEREELAKLVGGKQVKGKWLSPAEASRLEAKLVEHDGFWVTPDQKKKIVEGKLEYAEGEWLTAEEKEKFDQGQRRAGKAWKPADEMDPEHDKWSNPWSLKGRWVEVQTNAKHARGRWALKLAENVANAMVGWSGVEPDVYGKHGLLVLKYGRSMQDYKNFGAQAGSDWASNRSSNDGVFFSPNLERGRGGAVTYDLDKEEYGFAEWWTRRAAAETFIARFVDPSKLDPEVFDAFCAYFAGFKGAKYLPTWWHYYNGL
ncbi:MAG TPA: hypothetical protein VEI02_05235, partial [Planctomycetota bacterium]|nr:hypothetical protein [Planctomycetota bacterium]